MRNLDREIAYYGLTGKIRSEIRALKQRKNSPTFQLLKEKLEAVNVAYDMMYPTSVMYRIYEAESGIQITNTLQQARHNSC